MASFAAVNVSFDHLDVPQKGAIMSSAISTPTTCASPCDKLDLSKDIKIPTQVTAPVFEHDTGAPDGFEVFIGRMPLTMNDQGLMEMAKPFGAVEVRVLNKTDKAAHVCGFVVFNHLDRAHAFIQEYNGRTMMGGRYPLNVRFADGKNRKKLFIGGLAVGTREEDLRAITQAYGTILCIKMLAKNPKAPCGFVTFATGEQAAACIKYLHDTSNADDTKKYVVKLAKTDTDNNGRGMKRGGSDQSVGNKRGRFHQGAGRGSPPSRMNSLQHQNSYESQVSQYSSVSNFSNHTTEHQQPPHHYGQQQQQQHVTGFTTQFNIPETLPLPRSAAYNSHSSSPSNSNNGSGVIMMHSRLAGNVYQHPPLSHYQPEQFLSVVPSQVMPMHHPQPVQVVQQQYFAPPSPLVSPPCSPTAHGSWVPQF